MATTLDDRQAALERENTELRRQLDACHAELAEARAQQTATAEVLQFINSSPGDLAPVFDAMLEKAMRLCDATIGALWTYDGEQFALAALRGGSPELFDIFTKPVKDYDRMSTRARALRGEHVTHIVDARESEAYLSGDLYRRAMVDLGGGRSMVTVSLRRGDAVLGIFTIYRQEVRPFSEKQIALLQNFAAQAVIAIENARLLTETREALAQQTATAEVLQVINSSPGDLTPVFDAVLDKAIRVCSAEAGVLLTYDGECFWPVAHRGFAEFPRGAIRSHPETGSGRLARGEGIVHILDSASGAPVESGDPGRLALLRLGGARTQLAAALRKEGRLLGSFTIFRREVRPFTDKQITLLQNFAAQAVIAMENARLLTETREALEQQTATAEVLQVINSSPGDLTPVFDAILEKAHTFCGVAHGSLQLYENGKFRAVTTRGLPEPFDALLRRPREPGAVGARLLAGDRFLQLVDQADAVAQSASPDALSITNAQRAAGLRTVLYVALRKGTDLLGFIGAGRNEARPFTDKEIALLENFAAQAVIAMENARLLTETREALELQTATAEVLQVINSSPGDLAPVFDTMLEKAHSLCGVARGSLELYDGKNFRAAATHGLADSFAEQLRQGYPASANPATRPLIEGQPFTHILDRTQHEFPFTRGALDTGPAGTLLCVPLRRDEKLLGMIASARQEVRPFSDKQIALLQNFAAQAVIAIENARLLTETREALDQQTATAEVLQVINSSPGDLAPVFDAMLESAVSLCGAVQGVLWLIDGERLKLAGAHRIAPAFIEMLRRMESGELERPPQLRQLMAGERIVHVADVAELDIYRAGAPVARAAVESGLVRTLVWVALVKEGATVGAFAIARREVRPFTDKQIGLLQNFAAQAVIAIENARLITETREALEQQTATAEVLQVINSSPGDLGPVFAAILDKAHSLCGVAHGSLQLYDGVRLRAVATHGVSDAFADILRHGYPAADSPASRGLIEGARFVQIADCAEIDHPVFRSAAELAGIRTVLFVPLRRDDALLGLISSARREVRPFSDKEIALLQNFAAQAVIAMENARLLTETREALEQQTATAEVLQVINSSPGDLAPVFGAILEKALDLCEAKFGNITTYDGEAFHLAAAAGHPEFAEFLSRKAVRASPVTGLGRIAAGEQFVHIVDLASEQPYKDREPLRVATVELGGARTCIFVPLVKDNVILGVLTAYRQEVRPFTDKQIELLQNFAAQAVIAMENARLLTETREALEQQTATAEVLQVINSSPGDVQPTFDAIAASATRLCEAASGAVFRFDGSQSHLAAHYNCSPAELDALRATYPLAPSRGSVTGRAILTRAVAHVADIATDPDYALSSIVQSGMHAHLSVPMLLDGHPVGAITVARREAKPFSETQIELLKTFAAQAVIAMENARLITETREALEQQTATAEVLQVINSSPGDLAPVFDAILEKAHGLCRIALGALELHENGKFRAVAVRGVSGPLAELLRQPFEPPPESPLARLIAGEKVVQITDMSELARLRPDDPRAQAGAQYGLHTALFVPLRKDADLLGQVVAFRQELRPFSEKEIALLQNFAAQAVIAMENARLITETREALERQAATAEVLGIIASSPSRLEPVFEAMLANAVRICAGTFGTLALYDGEGYRGVAAHGAPSSFPDTLSRFHRPVPGTTLDGLEKTLQTVQLADCAAEPAYDPVRAANPAYARVRSHLCTPMIKDNRLLGAILIYRDRVLPFDDKQIELVENFAKQAVIAIENARLLTETREALEQQTATAEVLQVINSSPGDLAPVFDAILEKATHLCDVPYGSLELYDGERFRAVAVHGLPKAFADTLQKGYPASDIPATRPLIEGSRYAHITDVAETDYSITQSAAELVGARTLLCVPLRRDNALLGMIACARQEVRPFSEKEIALLQNFAAQAVIAMENARLLTETREALEQQTATAEVLQVINSSPGDLAPVFDAILEKAHTLCGAAHGALIAYDGEHFRAVAMQGMPEKFAELLRQPFRQPSGTPQERLLRGERLIHIPDVAAREQITPIARAAVDAGQRTVLFVPLRKDDALLGYISAYRREVRPFSDKEIALLQNFAAQAVIAMENARLITETREALAQQTATAEVLQVINSSPGDLAPVFDAMLEKATRLCEAPFGILRTWDGERFHFGAVHGDPRFCDWVRRRGPVRTDSDASLLGRIQAGERVVHITNAQNDEAYRASAGFREMTEASGIRSAVTVALHKDDALLGIITVYRQEVRPFSDKQIALLQNFAAQAVIAMENARLLGELRQRTGDLEESLEFQTATSDVLKVISQSTFDLEPVLQTVLDTAIGLCGNSRGLIFRRGEDGLYRLAVSAGTEQHHQDYVELEARQAIAPGTETLVGRTVVAGRPVQILDAMADPDYALKEEARVGQLRTMLGVPLLREGVPIGVICTARPTVEPFTEKQIALVTTFADQAVIAIENARLFNELRERTDDLQESLEYQTATSDVLKVISQSGAKLDPVLQTLVETAAQICDADKAVLQQQRDGLFRIGASFGFAQEWKDYRTRNPIVPDRSTPIGRMALERRIVHVEDALNDPEFTDAESQRLGGFRSMLAVPLFREDTVIGGLFLSRSRVEAFTEKQIALVATFADQAVIAIENARLLGELRERTAELGRSVEELKMLSEVGRAVSSTLDLRAVLSTILTASLGMTWATAGAIFRYNRAERAFRLVEAVGWDEALLGSVGDLRIAETETAMSEAALRRTPIQLTDLAERPSSPLRDASLAAGLRSVLIVPLVGPERIFGALVLQRREAGEFPAETVRLMQTLASQSVLAIQNARLFREIADKSEQLALASQHKSQFLANMSHELRTPLNAILGYAELLVDGIYGVLPERAQGVLERVQNNGKHLLALINDVLDLAKIEAGQLALTIEDYSLPEVVRSVVTATEPLAAAKGLKFTANVADGMPMAHGDARRVSQVLLNLAGNAIKFTDAGEVEINASAANGQFVLTVRDTGPGIADADQERIFGEFQQIENTDARKKGGTGLGLAISKRMVEMQGGMIWVDSTLGRGSTFRVVLPVQVEAMTEP